MLCSAACRFNTLRHCWHQLIKYLPWKCLRRVSVWHVLQPHKPPQDQHTLRHVGLGTRLAKYMYLQSSLVPTHVVMVD